MHRTNAMLLVSFDDLQGRKAKSCKRLRDPDGQVCNVYFEIHCVLWDRAAIEYQTKFI